MLVEKTITLYEDDVLEVECEKVFDELQIRIPKLDFAAYMTYDKARELMRTFVKAVSRCKPKKEKNPYAGDKTKGDAFEALRRAEQ